MQRKLYSLITVTLGGYCTYAGISIYKGEENFYRNYVMPLAHILDPETAHNLAVAVTKFRVFSKNNFRDPHLLVIIILY